MDIDLSDFGVSTPTPNKKLNKGDALIARSFVEGENEPMVFGGTSAEYEARPVHDAALNKELNNPNLDDKQRKVLYDEMLNRAALKAKAPPEKIDLSSFDGVDLSDFEEGPQTGVQRAISGAAKAIDFLAPIGTAIGGVSALGGLVTDTIAGKDDKLENAVKRIESWSGWNPIEIGKKIGIPTKYLDNPNADVPLEVLQKYTDKAGEWVLNNKYIGSPFNAMVTKVGLETAVMMLFFGGAHKAGKATIRPKEHEARESYKTPDEPVVPPDPPSVNRTPEGGLADPAHGVSDAFVDMPDGMSDSRQVKQRDFFQEAADLENAWKIDENGMPYKEIGPDAKGDLFREDTSIVRENSVRPDPRQLPLEFEKVERDPLTASREFDLREKIDADPIRRAEDPPIRDMAGIEYDPNYEAPKSRPIDQRTRPLDKMGNEVEFYPDNPSRGREGLENLQRHREGWDQKDAADAVHQKVLDNQYGNKEPSHGTATVEKVTKPTNSRTNKVASFRDRQRGGGKVGEGITQDLVGLGLDGLTYLRDKLKGLPSRTAEEAILLAKVTGQIAAKTVQPKENSDTKYRVNQTVTLESGQTGTIRGVTPNGYQVKLRDGGWDYVPHSGIAFASEGPARQINKGTFGQSGAVQNPAARADRQQAQDHRPWRVLKEDIGLSSDKPLRPEEDMGVLNKNFNVASIMTNINYANSRAVQILKNIVSRTQEIANQASKRYKNAVEDLHAYSAESFGSKKKIIEVAIKFDGMSNDVLASKGLQWPTTEMLRAEGLNDKQIVAYQKMTKGIDKAWDMIEEALSLAGQSVVRIPGYFPHFWTGSFKLKLTDGNTTIGMNAFPNKWAAELAARDMDKQGIKYIRDYPSSHIKSPDVAASIIDAMTIFRNKKGLGKPLLDMLIKFDELSKRGIIKSALERDANLSGFDAQKGFSSLNSFSPHNKRLIDAYRSHIESASEFWRNAKTANEVYGPYLRDIPTQMFDKAPHFKDAVQEFMQRASGQPKNHFSRLDEAFRAAGLAVGLPPNTFSSIVHALGASVTFSKLIFPNPKFLVNQALQPALAWSDILMAHQTRLDAGAKTGNVFAAWTTRVREHATFELHKRSKDAQAALDWAKENGKIDVYSADHVSFLHSKDPLHQTKKYGFYWFPQYLENRGRSVAFLSNYEYFKGVMSKEEAYHAAANETDLNMANYEHMNSASMFTDAGVTGRALRPFVLVRNAYLGKTMMAAEMAYQGIKKGNPRAVAPLMAMMGAYIIAAGATGMLGFQEWDMMARWWNSTNPDEPMTRPAEWLKKNGAPDWTVYGALAMSMGEYAIDIGPGLAAPAMTELAGVPAIDAGVGFAKVFKEAFTYGIGGNPNSENAWAGAQPFLPPVVKAHIEEQYFAPKMGGNVPGSNKFDATIARTPIESTMTQWTGARTITEQKRRSENSLYKGEVLNNKDWKAAQISKLVDVMTGIDQLGSVDKIIGDMIAAQRGFDADSIIKMVDAEMKRRVLEEAVRNRKSIGDANSVADKAYRAGLLEKYGSK